MSIEMVRFSILDRISSVVPFVEKDTLVECVKHFMGVKNQINRIFLQSHTSITPPKAAKAATEYEKAKIAD
jgi:hypothetical protein